MAVAAEVAGADVDLGVAIAEAVGRGVDVDSGAVALAEAALALGDAVAFCFGGAEGVDIGSLNGGAFDSVGVAGDLGVVRGVPVALGTSNRPRRCETDGDEIGDAVAAADVDGAGVVTRRGVIVGVDVATEAAAVAVAATEGAAVAVVDVPPACVAGLDVVAVAFTNFFGGAFAGGVASAFIFWRAFFASS